MQFAHAKDLALSAVSKQDGVVVQERGDGATGMTLTEKKYKKPRQTAGFCGISNQ